MDNSSMLGNYNLKKINPAPICSGREDKGQDWIGWRAACIQMSGPQLRRNTAFFAAKNRSFLCIKDNQINNVSPHRLLIELFAAKKKQITA